MKNLFDHAVAEATKQRILRLTPESRPLWGTMSVAQTLAHCTAGLRMAMRDITPKRAPFPASMVGALIKPMVFGNDKPLRRNSPSSPELFPEQPEQCDFERERAKLITSIDRFAGAGAAWCGSHPHPFFGPLKPEQWSILMYKHLDHHLRQFGA